MKNLLAKRLELVNQSDNLNKQFLVELREVISLNEFSYTTVNETQIELGVLENGLRLFASEITIYLKETWGNRDVQIKEMEINFGSSGSFSPMKKDGKASTLRTLHASRIIKNWAKVEARVKKYTKLKTLLNDKLRELNTQINLK